MTDPELTARPKPSPGDIAHTVVRAGLTLVPFAGGPLAELFAAVIIPPLTRRRDEWVESIAQGLKDLQEQVQGFDLQALSEDDMFVTTALHASQAAIRNHQRAKLEALRNAVLNAALPNAPDEDLQLMFLNFVDTLTAWHLTILQFFEDPVAWGRNHSVTYPTSWSMGGANRPLEHAFPALVGRRDFYDQVVKDLFSRGLMNTESLHVTMTSQGMFASRTTPMGDQFLRFVESPIEDTR